MSRGKGSDFEMIEGEAILSVRNENQGKAGKSENLRCKKCKKGEP